MATTDNPSKRYILVVPALVIFYTTFILFAVDYDKTMMKQWREKEIKITEETFLQFYQHYLKKKDK